MKRDTNSVLAWTILIMIVGLRLQDFLHLSMSTQDQLDFSTSLFDSGLWAGTLDFARGAGRIYFLVTKGNTDLFAI